MWRIGYLADQQPSIAKTIVSLKFIVSFEAAAFSFTNLLFPPIRFSLLYSGRFLSCLPHFASPAWRKKKQQQKNYLRFDGGAMWNTKDCARNTRRRKKVNFPSADWAVTWEPPLDCVCERSLFVKQGEKLFSGVSVKCGPDGGGWRMADGGWRIEKCGWKNADDKMRMKHCQWHYADDKIPMKVLL